jgi:hypothetical protein
MRLDIAKGGFDLVIFAMWSAAGSGYPKSRAAVTSRAAATPRATLADKFVRNVTFGWRAKPPATNIATTAIPMAIWLMVEVMGER